jgi:hypothetical protein
VWQRYWDRRSRDFTIVGVAQDVGGLERVRPVIEQHDVDFPVLIDRSSELGRALRFRIVPFGAFVDAHGVLRYRHAEDFDIADPRVRFKLDEFLSGRPVEAPPAEERMAPEALELFARGVEEYSSGRRRDALATWREALAHDPDNFVIRSQIWAVEHPEHFYPTVDRDWQALQLLKEGYDKPLP